MAETRRLLRSDIWNCLHCQRNHFYEGGGDKESVDLLCANQQCRHWFRLYFDAADGLVDVGMIEFPDALKERSIKEAAALMRAAAVARSQLVGVKKPGLVY